MTDRRLQLRAVLSAWVQVVAVALLVLALVGGWATYTAHVSPGTTTEQAVVSEWAVTGEFDHGATVTAENPVYDTGTRLSNRSTYFTGIAPELDGRFLTRVQATSASDLSVSLDTALVLQSAEEEQVYWRVERDLSERTVDDARTGSTVAVPFSVNATQVERRLERIGDSLGGSPAEPTAFVAVDVTVEGVVNGQEQSASFTERLTVSPGGGTYSVTEPEDPGEQFQRTESVAVPAEYGPLRTVGGPLAMLGGLAGLGALVVARRRNDLALSQTERAVLDYQSDRAEFDEWITQICLPDAAFEKPMAEAATLRDLVDFAIDTDAGVVESPDETAYYVVGDQYLYAYRPPTLDGSASDPLAGEPTDEGGETADDDEDDERLGDEDDETIDDEDDEDDERLGEGDVPLAEVASDDGTE
jgi:hypothetical protein